MWDWWSTDLLTGSWRDGTINGQMNGLVAFGATLVICDSDP